MNHQRNRCRDCPAAPAKPDDLLTAQPDGGMVGDAIGDDARRWTTDPANLPEPERAVFGYAYRARMREAREHFEQGGDVLVCERGHEPSQPVGPITTTHNRETTTWDDLVNTVRESRGRWPNQRSYIVPADVSDIRNAARNSQPAAPDPDGLRAKDGPAPKPGSLQVYDVEHDVVLEVTPAEAVAGLFRYARSLGPGTPAAGVAEQRAIALAREHGLTVGARRGNAMQSRREV